MELTLILFLFIFGLAFGSFLNVVIYRIQDLETVLGHSFCRHCKNRIRWYDNVPLLSYVILSGRCRDCKSNISVQYPLVELVTAFLFALTGMLFLFPLNAISFVETLMVLVVVCVSIVVIVYDIHHLEIPMLPLWIGIIAVVLALVWFDWASVSLSGEAVRDVFDLRLYQGIIAGFLAFSFFFILAAVSKETWMGLGDAYLGLFIGLTLGLPETLYAHAFAFFCGAVVGVVAILTKQKTRKDYLPLAPFLLGSLLLVLFIGQVYPHWWNVFLWV